MNNTYCLVVLIEDMGYMFDTHKEIEIHNGKTLNDAIEYFIDTKYPSHEISLGYKLFALVSKSASMERMPLYPLSAVWNAETRVKWVVGNNENPIPKRYKECAKF